MCRVVCAQMEDVGDPLEKIRVGHDDSGLGPAWHLEKVEVRKSLRGPGPGAGPKGSVLYEFPCNRWLAKNREDGAIARDLVCTRVVEELTDADGRVQKREFDRRDSLKSTSSLRIVLVQVQVV